MLAAVAAVFRHAIASAMFFFSLLFSIKIDFDDIVPLISLKLRKDWVAMAILCSEQPATLTTETQ